MKRFTIYAMMLIAALASTHAWGAEEKKAPAAAAAAGVGLAARRPNLSIVFGSITKIDHQDPTKPKLEVKSDVDGSIHTVELTPWTNVTKVTDIQELKPGDTVRIMARKVDANDVATTVAFGKIRNIYTPRPARTQGAGPASQPTLPKKAAGR